MKYNKPHLTLDEQLAKMEERGLLIVDREFAKSELARIGYYRLSGYLYQWRAENNSNDTVPDDEKDNFVGLHSLDEAIALYSFDRRLRLLLLDAIERIEVAVRVNVAHVFGRRGALAYLDRTHTSNYGSERPNRSALTNHETFIVKNQELVFRSSEVFAEHIRNYYDGYAPIWIAVECWDFGMISRFYPIMPLEDQIEVASNFQVTNYKAMANWLQAIGYLRNACAHHQRLYRKAMTHTIGTRNTKRVLGFEHVEKLPEIRAKKLYLHLCAITYLMRTASEGSFWPHALKQHLLEFPVIQNSRLSDYGFPDNWLDVEFWNLDDPHQVLGNMIEER